MKWRDQFQWLMLFYYLEASDPGSYEWPSVDVETRRRLDLFHRVLGAIETQNRHIARAKMLLGYAKQLIEEIDRARLRHEYPDVEVTLKWWELEDVLSEIERLIERGLPPKPEPRDRLAQATLDAWLPYY